MNSPISPPAAGPDPHSLPPAVSLSALLARAAGDASRARISVGDLLAVVQDRALAALLFVFAFPNLFPLPLGAAFLLAPPLVLLSAQLALGGRPWLPRLIRERSLAQATFAKVVVRALPWLVRVERLLRPRLGVLVRPPAEHLIGVLCALLALVLLMPVPFSNFAAASAICAFSLALLERDGVLVLVGLMAAAVAVVLVWGAFYLLEGTLHGLWAGAAS